MNSQKLPRGIRNNNPGNLRLSKIRWQGQKPLQFDPDFVEFESPEMGVRALMKTLLTYYRKYGLDTVQAIVNRWAPPHENATDYYAAHVAKILEVKRGDPLNVHSKNTMMKLAKAITVHENGWARRPCPRFWYEDGVYEEAYRLAIK